MIPQRLERLRVKMRECRMDAYLVPTADYHESEYVGPYFKCREYITGFTGSAGTAVITEDEACLWTDGRYFVQAAQQLKESGIRLMKMGEQGVPTVEEYLKEKLPQGGALGFDGKVVNQLFAQGLQEELRPKGITLLYDRDLVGEIWEGRPELSSGEIWVLDEKYAGKSAKAKLLELRESMEGAGATAHLLTTLDDIVWLLNIRGNDIPCNPVVLSYFVVTKQNCLLFIQPQAVNCQMKEYLESLGVRLQPYEEVYEFVKSLRGERILLEKSCVNYTLCQSLDDSNVVIDRMNPTTWAKAIKNETEMENIRRAHIKDGVAVTRFLYWVKNNIGKIPIDEISAADKLESLRKEQEGYLEPSFGTISAYGANAAMCHYQADEEHHQELQPRGLYLVDSGGQYYEGTTDITRTIVLGELTQEEREHFTLVAMGMLRLGNAQFTEGTYDMSLDCLARGPLWERGLDFNHGTGHGVGYLLNVHERPTGIHRRTTPKNLAGEVLMEGMLTSDEPGMYVEGSHGIRTENLLLCKRLEKNEYGQFMGFEFVTFVPIDLDGIEVSLMTPKDVEYLNAYHSQVFEKISPYLNEEETQWLREYTRPLKCS